MKEMWDIKYRPQKLSDYVFQSQENKDKFEGYVSNRTIPNLLLHGHRGTGKSTIARLLIKEIIDPSCVEFDVKVINASSDNGVDYMRTTITSFIETFAMGDIKIVLLEEADFLSHAAQGILRSLTEDYTSSVRFIITCNYPQKLIPELRSRFVQFHFNDMPINDMIIRIAEILDNENIEPDFDIIQSCVDNSYPDLRQILLNVQGSVQDGKLISYKKTNNHEWKESTLQSIKTGDWDALFSIARTDVPDNEIDVFIELVYNNINQVFPYGTSQFSAAVIIIADTLDLVSRTSLPYISLSAMIMKFKQLGK